MVSVSGPSLKKICLQSFLEKVVINQHFFSLNNLEHLEQEASRSFFKSLSTPSIMSISN
jgi:hypothetical protein